MPSGRIVDIHEFGHGNINNTYLVTLDRKTESHFILQRINTHVFLHPERVMNNMRIATDHARMRLGQIRLEEDRRWEVPLVIAAQDGSDHWYAPDGAFWRAISFIDDTVSFDIIKDAGHAEEVGYALGMFHALLSDLKPEGLLDTLEGFHITPGYLRHYHDVLSAVRSKHSPEIDHCARFVRERRDLAHVLETAKQQGRLRIRTVHGDPKVNNILIDSITGHAAGIVDLDTVKPGLVHYDIGDCLRSGCNLLGEETDEWKDVHFEPDLCRFILKGYLSMANTFLTESDFEHIYDSVRLMAFELGLRFFTDYLEGNAYFRVRSPEHNLVRALVQFRLTESIESQEKAIRRIIRDLR
ncbi:MAG: aminoglycoside phosphotransferase family protein [Nitrospirota bacterium]